MPVSMRSSPQTIVDRAGHGVLQVRLLLFSADLKFATVYCYYKCTGMCGLAYEGRYVLTRNGWRREGRGQY